MEQVLSLLFPRFPISLIYIDKEDFANVLRVPWALREEIPCLARNASRRFLPLQRQTQHFNHSRSRLRKGRLLLSLLFAALWRRWQSSGVSVVFILERNESFAHVRSHSFVARQSMDAWRIIFVLPIPCCPSSQSTFASCRSRSLSFVEAETNHYPGLFFKPANVSHFLWEAEMAEFKQCNYSQMSDMVNVHG